MVARTEKRKVGSLGGYQNHVDRKTEKHQNKDINPSKTYLNYDLVGHTADTTFNHEFMDYIKKKRTSNRAVRKDAVVMQDWLIGSSQEFFDNLSKKRQKEYFQVAVDFFADKFGRENIRFATVHMDEKTPHMHMGIVPMKDGRLTAKTIFDRNCLRMVQDELPKVFQKNGFDIERGIENSEKQHLHPEAFKKQSDKAYEDGKEKVDKIIEESKQELQNAKYELVEQLYANWEANWDLTSIEMQDFKFDDSSYKQTDTFKKAQEIEPQAKVDRSFPRRFKLAVNEVVDLIVRKFEQLSDYISEKSRYFGFEQIRLDQESYKLEFSTQRFEEKVKKQNTALSELAIDLGVHESWKDTMINKGGQIGSFTDGRTINKPFEELIPELISKASQERLEKVIEKQRTNKYNKSQGGMTM